MISLEDYFRGKPHSEAQEAEATILLGRVHALLDEARGAGVYEDDIDPDTGTQISGAKGGSGDGGFRLPESKTGAKLSSHKEAKAVDIYDPQGALDDWLTDQILSRHGLFREAPEATTGWTHLQTKAPKSGKRTFLP